MRVMMSALVLLALCAPAGAEIVRWTDERGEVHIGELESVPERYRGSTEVISKQRAPMPGGGAALTGPGHAAASVGSGSAAIRFRPGQPIMAIARINGSAVVSLMVEPAQTRPRSIARCMRAMGVDLRDLPTRPILGVGGVRRARIVTLDRLDVGGATVAPLQVDVMDTQLPGQGLLGRDFLGHFDVGMDNRAGILTLGSVEAWYRSGSDVSRSTLRVVGRRKAIAPYLEVEGAPALAAVRADLEIEPVLTRRVRKRDAGRSRCAREPRSARGCA